MAGFSNFIRRFVGRLRDQESDAPESRLPEAIPGLDRDPVPEPLDVSDGVVGRDPPALSVDAPLATPDVGGIPARPAQNPEFAFTSERMATPTAEFAGAAVAEPATTPMDDGGLLDDDVLREDPLSTACPYCGLVDQRVGARCQRCSQVVVRLPAWAQHRRHNWLFARLSWKRLIFASIVALLIVFVVWVNYPFAPNPLILLKKIQSQMTADVSPGVWTISGRDLRNSRSIDVGFPPPEGTVVWNSFIAEPLNSEPVAQHSNIYVGSADGIYSVAEHDGKIREGWDGNTPGRITGAAAVVESYLFFGSTDHTVNAWNALTGDAWWSFPAEDTVEVSPVISDGLVYISSGKGWLYALDANNGSVIWQTQLDSDASDAVAIHDGKLFVGDDKGIFYVLSARTGQEWFRYRTLKTIWGSPVISEDGTRAYFSSSGQLYAVSAEEREVPGLYQFKKVWAQLWLWQVPGIPRPPGQQGGLWRFAPENPLQGIYSAPALAEDEHGQILYVGGLDHTMYALNALDGSQLWTFDAEESVLASPVVIKDRLVFGDGAGNLYSLDRFNGSLDWKIFVGGPIKIPPTISNELLIVRTDDGHVYGIK